MALEAKRPVIGVVGRVERPHNLKELARERVRQFDSRVFGVPGGKLRPDEILLFPRDVMESVVKVLPQVLHLKAALAKGKFGEVVALTLSMLGASISHRPVVTTI